MASSRLPNLLYWTPQPDQVVDSLTPNITVSWSSDMATGSISDPETLPNFIQLIDLETSLVKELTYVSYEDLNTFQNQGFTFTFSCGTLEAGRTYQINILGGWQDVLGRTSRAIRTWTFSTPLGALSRGQQVSPAHESVQSTYPGFTWASQSGTGITYDLQVSTSPKFSTLVSDVTGLSNNYYTPDTPPTENITYYWRVRSLSATATGAWSEPFSFYYGTIQTAHADSRVTQVQSAFGLLSQTHANGLSHRYIWPVFSWTFTSTPASSFADYVEAANIASVATNATSGSWREVETAGTWTLSGNTITFTPTASGPASNTRYIFRIKSTLPNTTGVLLGTQIEDYLVGEYAPFYTDPVLLKSNLRSEYDLLDEDYVNYQIHIASKLAQLRFLSKDVTWSGSYPSDPYMFKWEDVNQVDLTDMATFFWVEARARLNIIRSIMTDMMRVIGSRVDIADYSRFYSKDTLTALQEAEKKAQDDLDNYENVLSGGSGIQTWGAISSGWSEANWYYDFQIGNVDGRRRVYF